MQSILRYTLKRPAAQLLALLFLSAWLSACAEKQQPMQSYSGLTMGTTFTVKWFPSATSQIPQTSAALAGRIDQLLVDVNQSMSTYIADSELSLFNKMPAGAQIEPSEALFQVLSLAQQVSEETAGAFDVTVGPLVNLWGFGPDGRITKAPSLDEINRIKQRVNYQYLQLSKQHLTKTRDVYVDLSAIAKGYGVDVIAQLLESQGIESYLVEIGGELRAKGLKPDASTWKVAIESPEAALQRTVQKVIAVKDVGIATSGDYRNYFEENGVRFSHTIDPATAYPIKHRLASVTVLAPTAAQADAVATAMLVMGYDKALEYAENTEVEAFFIVKAEQGFREEMTSGFSAYLVQ